MRKALLRNYLLLEERMRQAESLNRWIVIHPSTSDTRNGLTEASRLITG